MSAAQDEAQALAQRYARREGLAGRYSLLQPDVWQTVQERQRAMLQGLRRRGWNEPSVLRTIEVGCGSGGNLLELLRAGFAPENLTGIELLPQRLDDARACLPAALTLLPGDAAQRHFEGADIVMQMTVFSSILDPAVQTRLAQAMWAWLRPGGVVLWYDFTVNNPRNPDVRGVPLPQVRALFPQGRMTHQRVTLAPPLARPLCRVHPALYSAFNVIPALRTHVLAWIEKPLS